MVFVWICVIIIPYPRLIIFLELWLVNPRRYKTQNPWVLLNHIPGRCYPLLLGNSRTFSLAPFLFLMKYRILYIINDFVYLDTLSTDDFILLCRLFALILVNTSLFCHIANEWDYWPSNANDPRWRHTIYDVT